MKEKFLVFKDGHKERIIREGPYITEDPNHKYCDTCEYITDVGNVYKRVKPGVKQVSHPTWYKRDILHIPGTEVWIGNVGVYKIEEEDAKPYCMLDGNICTYICGATCPKCTGCYCNYRTYNANTIVEKMNKKIEHLEAKCGDQDKEIEDLISSNNHLIEQAKTLNKEKDELKEKISELEKDNYIANDNLTAMAAKNMKLRDENTKLEEKVDVYNKEVKQWLNGFYGQPLQPFYYAGMRSGGKTLFAENDKLKKELAYYKERCDYQKSQLLKGASRINDLEREIKELRGDNEDLYQKYYRRGNEMYDYKMALRILGSDVSTYGVYRCFGDGGSVHRIDSTIKSEDEYKFVKDMMNKARM